jgi:hypothetical protein
MGFLPLPLQRDVLSRVRFPFGTAAMGIGAVCGTGAELLVGRGTFLLGFTMGSSAGFFAGAFLDPPRRGRLTAAGVLLVLLGAIVAASRLRLFG